MELPYISICTPTYNRNNFIPLMLSNLAKMDYPKHKLEWIIDDDGTDKFIKSPEDLKQVKKVIAPIQLKYFWYPKKRTIGVKRNNMVKKATHKIIACMDTDDMYMSTYLKRSLDKMREEGASLVGSNQMIFIYPHNNFKITAIACESKRQIHEASMLFTKKHFNAMGGFGNNCQGEGSRMVDGMSGNRVALTQITDCLICIAHKGNTVDKEQFIDTEDITEQVDLSPIDIEMIKDILCDEEYIKV